MSALSIDLASLFAWLVPTSVFVAGLVGSPHCVAMCGPLVMSFAREKKTLAAYQLGRMLTYTAIGAVVGSMGQLAFRSPSKTFSLVSLALLAGLLVVMALRARFASGSHLQMPKWVGQLHARLWKLVRSMNPNPAAMSFVAGALTVFLPCLHLYAFVAGAAATGSSAAGAAFMFTFWLSTVPALSAAPLFIKRLFGGGNSVAAKQWATALMLVAALASLGQFAFRMDQADEAPTAHHHATGHEHHH